MSGETEDSVSGWTVDTVRTHFMEILRERDIRYQQRFEDQENAVAAALAAAAQATAKAEAAADRRFEGVNEFREQLRAQADELAAKVELEAVRGAMNIAIDSLRERISDLAARLDRSEGKSAGMGSAGGIIVSVIGAAAAIIGIIIATR